MMKIRMYGVRLLASGAVLIAGAAWAENDAPQSSRARTIELDPILIEGESAPPLSLPALPSELNVDGPFGSRRSVLDTPRAVTPISKNLIDRANIVEIRDLQRVAPNTYAPNTFGVASLPEIRGQLGEVFQDGLRRQGGNNGFGAPLSFNSFDQIDVVKGPPPVVLGSTQRVGGFINLIPKRPDLNQARGSLELQAGSWDRYLQQLDYSRPLDQGRSGVRISVENRNEGSYYDFVEYDSQSVFAAYRLKPDAATVFDLNFEYFNVDFTDNGGWNRSTQELIDNGTYITGEGLQPDGSSIPAPGAVISPTGTAQIPRSRVLTDPDDINGNESIIANARFERTIAPGWRVASRGIYQHFEREEIAQNSFVEIIDDADTVENRTELIIDYASGLFGLRTHQQSTVGLDVRYHDVTGYSQFTTEADNPIDLTAPVESRRIPLTPAQRSALVELRPGVFVSPGGQYDLDGDGEGDFMISDTTDSTHYQIGAFAQQDVQLTPRWSVLGGVRGDWYDVIARDPIPPPGVEAAEDSTQELLGSANGSLTFKPVPSVATYAAVSYSESTSNSLGGGFVLGEGNQIDAEDLATETRLYEVGVKYAPENADWYADLALFDQTRSLRNRDGSNSGIKTRGVEAQLAYQPEQAYFNLAASYLDARFDDASAVQDSRAVVDAFDDSRPDIINGTGIGSPNVTVFAPSDRRVQGLPDVLVSALAGYEFFSGLGVDASVVYTSSFPLDYLGTVKIRDQYTLNAAAHYFWRRINTDFRLDVLNLTDQENFSPIFDGGFFGSTLVFPEQPISALLSVRHHF